PPCETVVTDESRRAACDDADPPTRVTCGQVRSLSRIPPDLTGGNPDRLDLLFFQFGPFSIDDLCRHADHGTNTLIVPALCNPITDIGHDGGMRHAHATKLRGLRMGL